MGVSPTELKSLRDIIKKINKKKIGGILSTTKIIITWMSWFVGFIVVLIILELVGLGFFKFFGPVKENINREIYENTQSFNEGKLQDLAKYFKEYNETQENENRVAIQTVIQTQFAYFDAEKVQNQKLKTFLIKMRGF